MDKPAKRIPEVRLEHFKPHLERSETDTILLLETFNALLRTTADAALDTEPSIYSFQEKCLYFALIHDDAQDPPSEDNGREMNMDWRDDSTQGERYSRRQQTASIVRGWQARAGRSFEDEGKAPRDPFGYYEYDTALNELEHEDTTMADLYEYQPPLPPSRLSKTFVGIIYFLHHPQYPLEVSLGVALLPAHCNRGIGPRAVLQVLEMAFDQFAFHRVSAAIVDGPSREHAIRMFVALGFVYEGNRRRAIMSAGPGQDENTWRDVHFLGLLDTDWAMNGGAQVILRTLDADCNNSDNTDRVGKGKATAKAKRTRWDEMFARHQREREEVVGFDERVKVLRRTLSSETLRPATSAADSGTEALSASEAESDAESVGARDQARSVSPVLSIATNPFVSPQDLMLRMQPSVDFAHPQAASGSASVLEDRESMVSAWRTSSVGYDSYGESDRESDSEVQALIPSARFYATHTPPRRNTSPEPEVFGVRAMHAIDFASPPPQSDTESVSAYASESEVERYASCEEDDDNDNDDDDGETNYTNEMPNNTTSSTVLSRLPSGLSVAISQLEAQEPLVPSFDNHGDAKRRRVDEDGTFLDIISSHTADDVSRALETPSAKNDEVQLLSTPVAGPSIYPFPQDPPAPTFLAPSLSYRLSEHEIHGVNAVDVSAHDAELDWDVLSSTSESESSVTSASSLSLQSASDSE